MAASELLQPLVTPHCQEAPPIFGPLPRSTVGMTARSLPSALRALSAAQEPVYTMALLLFRKSCVESLPLFLAMKPWSARPRNHVAHSTAFSPLRAPSADWKPSRLMRSPPKDCSSGE